MSALSFSIADHFTRLGAWWSALRQIPLTVDPTLCAALAAVAWLDGVRRADRASHDDVLLLRRPLLGAWRVVKPRLWNGVYVASWWAPCVSSVTLSLDEQVAETIAPPSLRWSPMLQVARARRRLQRVHGIDRLLRALGLLLLFMLIVVAPVAAFSYGIAALVRSALIAAELVLVLFVVSFFALRHLGFSWRNALRRAVPLLSPFTAPRASEIVWRAALEPHASAEGTLVAARTVLGETRFATWARPFAYDALHASDVASVGESHFAAALIDAFGIEYAHDIVAKQPSAVRFDEGAGAYCPRCGATFASQVEACSDCQVVRLLPVTAEDALAERAS